MIGELRWLDRRKKHQVDGMHRTWGDAKPFRWSGAYAWSKIAVGPIRQSADSMYASHVLLRYRRWNVAIYLIDSGWVWSRFPRQRWKTYTYDLSGVQPARGHWLSLSHRATWCQALWFDDVGHWFRRGHDQRGINHGLHAKHQRSEVAMPSSAR